MRTLKRNKVKVWYVNLDGETEIVNEGIRTGEYRKTYTAPAYLMANVSPATGNTSLEPFGVETNYSHVMVIEGTSCPINETTQLYLGDNPLTATDNFFMVARIAKSLNHTRIALKETEVDGSEVWIEPTPPTPSEGENNG